MLLNPDHQIKTKKKSSLLTKVSGSEKDIHVRCLIRSSKNHREHHSSSLYMEEKLFIQLNTPLRAASAAAEGLLICCGLAMNSKRTRLNYELFEDSG